jgi:hypothetical protein
MIKRRYLIEKVAEQEKTGTFHERRAYTKFWRKRIGSTHQWHLGGEAVFLCGKHAWRADILNVTIEKTTPNIKDVVNSEVCYNIECKFPQEEFEWLLVAYPQ